jgi:hypothetical protein
MKSLETHWSTNLVFIVLLVLSNENECCKMKAREDIKITAFETEFVNSKIHLDALQE